MEFNPHQFRLSQTSENWNLKLLIFKSFFSVFKFFFCQCKYEITITYLCCCSFAVVGWASTRLKVGMLLTPQASRLGTRGDGIPWCWTGYHWVCGWESNWNRHHNTSSKTGNGNWSGGYRLEKL